MIIGMDKDDSYKVHDSLTSLLAIIVYAVNCGERDSLFTIGKTFRIRIGHLKGYRYRVIGLHFSDVNYHETRFSAKGS